MTDPGARPSPDEAATPEGHRKVVSLKDRLKSVGFLLALAATPFLLLMVLWRDRCHKDALQQIRSPDGKMLAEQVITNCGKTMRVASEIRLSKVDGGGEATVLILPSDDHLPLVWAGDHNLTVQLPGSRSQVVKYRREWSGTQVVLIGDIISSVPEGIGND